MKTQAWGWLATAVLAAGLNSTYHNGGLEWLHEAADRVQHNTNAVLALATGRADRFLAEAQFADAQNSRSCPVGAVLAAIRRSIAPVHTDERHFDKMAAREEMALARLEANRARIEAQLVRVNVASFTPMVMRAPRIACPRVRVSVPSIPAMRMPVVRIPAPAIRVDCSGAGPV